MFEDINQHRAAVAEQIKKACEIGFTGSELEKAHKVGDIHPNGKWVWTQLPSGKYDWRVIKKTAAPSGGSASAAAQKTEEKKISISANRPALASVPGVSRIKDALTTYNSKYTDLSKVELIKTPKGNWDLYYDGHRLGIVAGYLISDHNAAKMGWVRDGTDDLRSKRDAEEDNKAKNSDNRKQFKIGSKITTDNIEDFAKRINNGELHVVKDGYKVDKAEKPYYENGKHKIQLRFKPLSDNKDGMEDLYDDFEINELNRFISNSKLKIARKNGS